MTFEEQFEQLQKMFDSSDCDIEVLPPDEEKAKKLRAQGGEFTPLAAILAGTGGVSVNGILRFLGSGMMDFFERNERLSEMGMTIVAEDVFRRYLRSGQAGNAALPRTGRADGRGVRR